MVGLFGSTVSNLKQYLDVVVILCNGQVASPASASRLLFHFVYLMMHVSGVGHRAIALVQICPVRKFTY